MYHGGEPLFAWDLVRLMTKLLEQKVEFDMVYTDSISVSLSTSALFNYPLPYFVRLPVTLTVSLSLFSSNVGRLIYTIPQNI